MDPTVPPPAQESLRLLRETVLPVREVTRARSLALLAAAVVLVAGSIDAHFTQRRLVVEREAARRESTAVRRQLAEIEGARVGAEEMALGAELAAAERERRVIKERLERWQPGAAGGPFTAPEELVQTLEARRQALDRRLRELRYRRISR
jgi:hypothetical protein